MLTLPDVIVPLYSCVSCCWFGLLETRPAKKKPEATRLRLWTFRSFILVRRSVEVRDFQEDGVPLVQSVL